MVKSPTCGPVMLAARPRLCTPFSFADIVGPPCQKTSLPRSLGRIRCSMGPAVQPHCRGPFITHWLPCGTGPLAPASPATSSRSTQPPRRPPPIRPDPGAHTDLPRGYKTEDHHHFALVPRPITNVVEGGIEPKPPLHPLPTASAGIRAIGRKGSLGGEDRVRERFGARETSAMR